MRGVMLAAVLTFVPVTQTDTPSIVGSWAGEFKGQTFLRLDLRVSRGALTGSLGTGDIEVDDQGGLRRVGTLPSDPKPLFDFSQTGATVTFSRKDGEGTDRFEFRVLDHTRGELRFLFSEEMRKELAAEGIPVPKPILLTRRAE